jgi:hypothetical protein
MTAIHIIYRSISVEKIEKNGGVFVGNNNASNWSSHNKNQTAISASGNNRFSRTAAVIIDNNLVDFQAKK